MTWLLMMRGNLASKATPSTRAPPIQSTTDAEPLSTVLLVLTCGRGNGAFPIKDNHDSSVAHLNQF